MAELMKFDIEISNRIGSTGEQEDQEDGEPASSIRVNTLVRQEGSRDKRESRTSFGPHDIAKEVGTSVFHESPTRSDIQSSIVSPAFINQTTVIQVKGKK
jgi:hypothetical protein